MPSADETLARLAACVRGFEQRLMQSIPPMNYQAEDEQLEWLVLTADLAAAGSASPTGYTITVPTTATANPAGWQAAGNTGTGGYVVDTSTTYLVVNGNTDRSYKSGDMVCCRALGTYANGWLWEPISAPPAGNALIPFQLSEDVSAASPIYGPVTANTFDLATQSAGSSLGGGVYNNSRIFDAGQSGATGFALSIGGKNEIVSLAPPAYNWGRYDGRNGEILTGDGGPNLSTSAWTPIPLPTEDFNVGGIWTPNYTSGTVGGIPPYGAKVNATGLFDLKLGVPFVVDSTGNGYNEAFVVVNVNGSGYWGGWTQANPVPGGGRGKGRVDLTFPMTITKGDIVSVAAQAGYDYGTYGKISIWTDTNYANHPYLYIEARNPTKLTF